MTMFRRDPGDRAFIADVTAERIDLLLIGRLMPEPEKDDEVPKIRISFTAAELQELIERMKKESGGTADSGGGDRILA